MLPAENLSCGALGLGERHRVLYIYTTPLSARWFLRGLPRFMRKAGFDVFVASSPGQGLDLTATHEGAQIIEVPMAREISPVRDLVSLWRVWRLIRRLRPAITNVGNPKAGLLGGLAARFCRVPCRVYTLHGLRLETVKGPKRLLLWLAEWCACRCAHRVICVSESLRNKALSLGLSRPDRLLVLGSGSCNGVDAERFAPSEEMLRRAETLRDELNICKNARVIGFVGRLTRDKGILELVDAYFQLRRDFPKLTLLLVGGTADGDVLPGGIRQVIRRDPGIVCTGFVDDTAVYYHVMDVLALPSYREGFGIVALEAHAAARPVVAARATGTVDAVIDGVDGLLVAAREPPALADALARLLRDSHLANRMGLAGRERVLREFRQESVWRNMLGEYVKLLRRSGLVLPQSSVPESTLSLASDRSRTDRQLAL